MYICIIGKVFNFTANTTIKRKRNNKGLERNFLTKQDNIQTGKAYIINYNSLIFNRFIIDFST